MKNNKLIPMFRNDLLRDLKAMEYAKQNHYSSIMEKEDQAATDCFTAARCWLKESLELNLRCLG